MVEQTDSRTGIHIFYPTFQSSLKQLGLQYISRLNAFNVSKQMSVASGKAIPQLKDT